VYRAGEKDFITESAASPFPAITLLRPNAQGSAWDPSDPATPERDLLAATWRDGSPAKVKIRAISDSGPVMRVFFDVPGPGVLVDPHSLDGMILQPGQWNTVPLPVTNTGETKGTFAASLAVPAGWVATSSPPAQIGPGDTALLAVKVKPYLQSKMGTYTVTATASATGDASVTSSAPLDVVINTPPVVLKRCLAGPCLNVQVVTPGGVKVAHPLPVPVDRFSVRPKPYGPALFDVLEPRDGPAR
jgi:hypothetical protein